MKDYYDKEILSEIFSALTEFKISDKQAISNLVCSFIDYAKLMIPEIPLSDDELKVYFYNFSFILTY